MHVIYSTFPDIAAAESAALALIEEKLAACCNLLPGMRSIYRWEGAVQTESEVVLLVKTSDGLVPQTLARLAQLHPYENPALFALPVSVVASAYEKWLESSVAQPDSAS